MNNSKTQSLFERMSAHVKVFVNIWQQVKHFQFLRLKSDLVPCQHF